MPVSEPRNWALITRLMERENPHSVLDVGVGYGHFGYIFRERLDDFKWELWLVGMDPFRDYIDRSGMHEMYDLFYDFSFPDPLLYDLPGFDLILMIDVLEHFSDSDASVALKSALELAPAVLISTPLDYPQGPEYGNQWERHLSEWPVAKIAEHGKFEDYSDGVDWVGSAAPNHVVGVLRRR